VLDFVKKFSLFQEKPTKTRTYPDCHPACVTFRLYAGQAVHFREIAIIKENWIPQSRDGVVIVYIDCT
jgi:hypothetical protein